MLAENLLLLRKQNRLTQEQVAQALGVSGPAVNLSFLPNNIFN